MPTKRLARGAAVTALLIATAAASYAKEPSSAFGSAYDARSSAAGRGADADSDDDGSAGESPKRTETRVRPPNPHKRLRIQLDGGFDRRDPRGDDDDDW
jgi:hypothetical protein